MLPIVSPVPQHEAELERATISEFFYTLRHPSRTSTFVQQLIQDTEAYYAAEDVTALDRREIIEILSYTRKMAVRMGGIAIVLTLTTFLCLFTKS